MNVHDPLKLLEYLLSLGRETEWLEFKRNNADPDNIGRYASALANSAMLVGEEHGYLVFGIEDVTIEPVGTELRLRQLKVGNDTFLYWLSRRLEPHITVDICEFDNDGKHFEILIIQPGFQQPVRFNGQAFVRVDTSLQPLNQYPDRERSIWAAASRFTFEEAVAKPNLSTQQILKDFEHTSLFEALGLGARSPAGIVATLESEQLIKNNRQGGYDVTNLFALVAASDLNEWSTVANKAPRVVTYKGSSKITAEADVTGSFGYGIAFPKMLAYIMDRVEQSEKIIHGVRRKQFAIPEIAVRELLANALIHQDMTNSNDGPLVEIYPDRIKIINPGTPLVDPDRFIDSPPKSRNKRLGALLRRMGLCEERGSGVDRALAAIEDAILPAPLFQVVEGFTVVTVYGAKAFADLSREDRVRACYQHACVEFEAGRQMSNSSLRKRFGLTDRQYPQVSNVIKEALESGRIRPLNDNQGNRYARYLPYWA
ncbi:Predicted transcriptional regulator, contains HTH domain [Devosia enhydra]|uniref:Predicted transcriptional regulator, contains HTH domain n=1 Tax=Devosia enhydra TaxID=665118 RepID=A0A1K2I2Q8_9HYPH|nr:ATP-binding protein [Devosia enhydra]SFZ86670.1 Predicted transcriptional regulator, contains HTH domain [Devosia enhydra]